MNLGPQIKVMAELRILLPHDGVRDDGVDLDGGDVVAAGGQCARHIPAPAGSDDQGFGAGADHIGEAGAFVEQLVALAVEQVVEVELGDAGGGVGVDDDAQLDLE